MTSPMVQLSPRQLASLAEIQGGLSVRPESGRAPTEDDEVSLAVLDAWIAGVLSSGGQASAASVRDLLELQLDSRPASHSERLIDSVVAVVLPSREVDDDWPAAQLAVVKDHCRSRGYVLEEEGFDEFGSVRWSVTCGDDATPVRMSTNGELVTVSFPGGYSWTEFGYSADESGAALATQLRLVDAYADPATREVLARRWFGRRRRELHIAGGTKLWRSGGSRVYPTR